MKNTYNQTFELYTTYLIANTSQITSTGLSTILEGSVRHDAITRFLSKAIKTSKDLWLQTKRQVEGSNSGVLIIDDTIEAKPYSKESSTINYWYDHTVGRCVKGLNILSCHYDTEKSSSPIGFTILEKEQVVLREEGETDKIPAMNKQEQYRKLLKTAVNNSVSFSYVLNDKWFASVENMNYIIKDLKKDFVMPLKENRLIALTKDSKDKGLFVKMKEETLGETTVVYLKDLDFPVLLIKQRFKDGADKTVVIYLVTSDLTLTKSQIIALYQRRWKVEESFKSMKSNLNLSKSPCHSRNAMHNHIYCVFYACAELSFIARKNNTNTFALKKKIYLNAMKVAMENVQQLRTEFFNAA